MVSAVGADASSRAPILPKLEFKERLLSIIISPPHKAFICANSLLIPFHISSRPRPPPPNPFRHPSNRRISQKLARCKELGPRLDTVAGVAAVNGASNLTNIALPKTLVLNGRHRRRNGRSDRRTASLCLSAPTPTVDPFKPQIQSLEVFFNAAANRGGRVSAWSLGKLGIISS